MVNLLIEEPSDVVLLGEWTNGGSFIRRFTTYSELTCPGLSLCHVRGIPPWSFVLLFAVSLSYCFLVFWILVSVICSRVSKLISLQSPSLLSQKDLFCGKSINKHIHIPTNYQYIHFPILIQLGLLKDNIILSLHSTLNKSSVITQYTPLSSHQLGMCTSDIPFPPKFKGPSRLSIGSFRCPASGSRHATVWHALLSVTVCLVCVSLPIRSWSRWTVLVVLMCK